MSYIPYMPYIPYITYMPYMRYMSIMATISSIPVRRTDSISRNEFDIPKHIRDRQIMWTGNVLESFASITAIHPAVHTRD
jgi:hypothetical protein